MAEFFDPSVHLLEPPVQEILSTSSLEGPLAERGQGSSRGGVVVRLRALYPQIRLPRKDGAAGPGGPPHRRVLAFQRCPLRMRRRLWLLLLHCLYGFDEAFDLLRQQVKLLRTDRRRRRGRRRRLGNGRGGRSLRSGRGGRGPSGGRLARRHRVSISRGRIRSG